MEGVLFAIVAAAFTVEAALGFGASLVMVTLGALLLDIRSLLVAVVPLNVTLSLWLVVRGRRHVDTRLLFRAVLPLMALGLPLGMWALRALDASLMKRTFGVFVTLLALSALANRGQRGPAARSAVTDRLLLFAGGVVHGAFATGGPMAVYVVGQRLADKAAFRATLSSLWLVLNSLLVISFVVDGRLDAASLVTTAKLLGALAVGLVVGEVLHRRVPEHTFRTLVWVVLGLGGAMLVIRG
jgi:uncharacterized membrane protein YfcA